MARINLLPWRQEVRERKNKEFMTLIVAVLLPVSYTHLRAHET